MVLGTPWIYSWCQKWGWSCEGLYPIPFSLANSRWKSFVKVVVSGYGKIHEKPHKQRGKTGPLTLEKGSYLKMIFQAPNSHLSHILNWGLIHCMWATVRRCIPMDWIFLCWLFIGKCVGEWWGSSFHLLEARTRSRNAIFVFLPSLLSWLTLWWKV